MDWKSLLGGDTRPDPTAVQPLEQPGDVSWSQGVDALGGALKSAGSSALDWRRAQYQQSIDQGLVDPATGLPTDRGMKGIAGAIAGGVGDAGLPAGVGSIRAFHGSPHTFDRFDMSKIGTGEGAQAYGHGLYFAGKEGVAKSYRDALSGSNIIVNGEEVSRNSIPWGINDLISARGASHYQHGNLETTLKEYVSDMTEQLKNPIEGRNPRWYKQMADDLVGYQDALNWLQINKVGGMGNSNPGKMYEVELGVQPHELLDWDKSGQSTYVKDALKRGGVLHPDDIDRMHGSAVYRAAKDNVFGPESSSTEALRSAGVPGIKYLDQGSRDTGVGSHNYVMFDDKLIKILRKYGILPAAVGAGAAAQDNSQ